jgi:serine/threonine protein kinase
MSHVTLNNLSPQITSPYSAETNKDKVSDSYEFTGEVLGKGGFGLVQEGKDRKTGSPVAIKTQARSLLAQTEANMSKTLKVAHVVCCREIFEDTSEAVHSKVYIVMDLVPGKNIKEAFLKPACGKSLAFNDIVYITHQSLEFISELFRKRIVYFDFKPENLMYDEASHALTVVDLGGVRPPDFDTSIKFTTTANYRSPEFILKNNFGSTYDCWSLACTIYKIVTTRELFFIPTGVPSYRTNNYLLQAIVKQLGKPTPAYLSSCEKAQVYFEMDMEFKRDLDLSEPKKWDDTIREVAADKKWPSGEVDQLINLMSRLLCYENRATAEELLTHPLFSKQQVVHLVHDRQKTGKMFIQRASTIPVTLRSLTVEHILPHDFVIEFHQPIPKCLHLPKDPEGKYVVILEKDGNGVAESFFFRDSNVLDIRALQKRMGAGEITVSSSSSSLPSDPMQISTPPLVSKAKRRLSFSEEENATESSSFKKPKTEE